MSVTVKPFSSIRKDQLTVAGPLYEPPFGNYWLVYCHATQTVLARIQDGPGLIHAGDAWDRFRIERDDGRRESGLA